MIALLPELGHHISEDCDTAMHTHNFTVMQGCIAHNTL